MGIVSSTCRQYQPKEELNNFQKLQLTNEPVPFPEVYAPMNSYVVQDESGFKLVKCCLTDINQSVFNIQEKLEEQMEASENPYLISVHFLMNSNQENKLKSIIPFHDHITCWMDMYRNTLEQKLQQTKELNETEVLKLIDTVSFCLYQMQMDKKYQDSLGISTIYELEAPFREFYFSVENRFLEDSAIKQFNLWKLDYNKHKYLKDLHKQPPSPKCLELIKKNSYEKRNHYKDEVFTFGIVVLQCFLGINIVDFIYDEKDLCIKQDLDELLLQIPQSFRGLMKNFLIIDENDRPDWIEIHNIIQEFMGGKRLLDKYKSQQFLYDYENTEKKFEELSIKKHERQSKFILFNRSPLFGSGLDNSMDQQMYSPENHDQIKEDMEYDASMEKQQEIQNVKQNRELELDQKLKEKKLEEYQKYQSRLVRIKTKQLQKKQQNYKPFQSQISHYADEKQYIEVYEKETEHKKTQGTITYENGDIYIGDIHDKKKSGYGQIKNKHGFIIAHGKFKADLYDGNCVIYNPQEKQKVSIFSPGHWDVQMTESNWVKFEGEFHRGLKSGYGKIYFSDGSTFEGKFKEDMARSKKGVYTYKDGKKVEGQWFNNIYTLY